MATVKSPPPESLPDGQPAASRLQLEQCCDHGLTRDLAQQWAGSKGSASTRWPPGSSRPR